jgi:hypothetical protein
MSGQRLNPFYVKTNEIDLSSISSAYVLCLNDGLEHVDNSMYSEYLTEGQYEWSQQNMMLIKVNKYMINSSFKFLVVVNKNVLELYNNKFKYNFVDDEVVMVIPNICYSDLKKYIDMYTHKTLKDVVKMKLIKDYVGNNKPKLCIYDGLSSSKYWTYPKNCKLTHTNEFIKRNFRLKNNMKLSDDVRTVIDTMSISKQNRNANYIADLLMEIEEGDDMKTSKYYVVDKPDVITKEHINELFENTMSERELYKMFNTLLVSKKYCHLVVNNSFVLDKMKSIINKYKPIYNYLFGYTWLTFYTEEMTIKTRTTVDKRYVFDIDTASKLPVFPYSAIDPHSNPYIALLLPENVLDPINNIQGLQINSSEQGISTLDEFKINFNIFTTGNAGINILENVDWSNIAVSGSSMTACIPKTNPLMYLFENNDKFRYYNEYYAKSDLDIMCNLTNIFEFTDKVFNIAESVKQNLQTLQTLNNQADNLITISIDPIKSAVIMVSQSYIKENIKNDYKYAIDNINSTEIKEIFYHKYVENKIKHNKLNREKGFISKNYESYYNIVGIDDIKIIIVKNEIEENDKDYNTEYINDNGKYIKIKEILKFKIRSPYLLHEMEIFQINYPDFFSCVARFHLPCVRSFYNGDNVYLLPSAITAYLTMQNIDYKYFSGSKDPIEIINKYRMRGYGTFLNKMEKIHIVEYTSKIKKWNALFQIDIKNVETVKSMFGQLELTHTLFKPRRFSPNEYYDSIPVIDKYNMPLPIIDDTWSTFNLLSMDFLKFKSINNEGYVEPFKTWVEDAVYDLIKNKK